MNVPQNMLDQMPDGASLVYHRTGETWNDGGRWHTIVYRVNGQFFRVRMGSDYVPDRLTTEEVVEVITPIVTYKPKK
jgi:uncharacterized membrane protein